MSYVTTKDDCKLFVNDWGKGRPVIMTYGWPLSADSFEDLSMALADAGMRAISYDRRGFGRFDHPWSGYDYDTLADDLAAVMEQTMAHDATLVGFSMGGGEVARYLSRHGDKLVKQAVLIDSVVPYMFKTSDNPEGVDPSVFDAMTLAMKDDRAKFWLAFFKHFFGVGIVTSPVFSDVIECARSVSTQAGWEPTLACAKAFVTTDFRGDLSSFQVPTLIIHGTGEKTVPIDTAGRKAAQGIPHAKLIEYDGAPHCLFASHTNELLENILEFVNT